MMIIETTSRECCQPQDLIAASPVKVAGLPRHKRCKFCRLSWVLVDALPGTEQYAIWRPEDPVPEVKNADTDPLWRFFNYPMTLSSNSLKPVSYYHYYDTDTAHSQPQTFVANKKTIDAVKKLVGMKASDPTYGVK